MGLRSFSSCFLALVVLDGVRVIEEPCLLALIFWPGSIPSFLGRVMTVLVPRVKGVSNKSIYMIIISDIYLSMD